MTISKTKIKEYCLDYYNKVVKEVYTPLPNIRRLNNLTYEVSSADKLVAAFIEFEQANYEDLHGPSIVGEQPTCYEVFWNFAEGSKQTPVDWSNVTATVIKVLEDFIKHNQDVQVYYFKGMIGTTTDNQYKKKYFVNHIDTVFGDRFIFYTKQLSRSTFFLLRMDLKFKDDQDSIERDLVRNPKLTLESALREIELAKYPWKNKKHLKGTHKWSIYREQIERIVLKRLYK